MSGQKAIFFDGDHELLLAASDEDQSCHRSVFYIVESGSISVVTRLPSRNDNVRVLCCRSGSTHSLTRLRSRGYDVNSDGSKSV